MPAIQYSSPAGGGYRVDVPGGGGMVMPGGGGQVTRPGGGMDLSWIGDFAKKQAANKLAQQDLELRAVREAMRPRAMTRDTGRPSLRDQQVLNAQRTAAIEQARAAAQQARVQTMTPGQQRIYAGGFLPPRTAAQRSTSMAAGLTGQAYSDMAREMGVQQLMKGGSGVADYEGWTKLVQALNQGGGGGEAVKQAGQSALQQQAITADREAREAEARGRINALRRA